MSTRTLGAIGAVVLLLGLGACTGAASDSPALSSDGAAVGSAVDPPESGSQDTGSTASLTSLSTGLKQIVTGAITVRTDSVLTAAHRVEGIATAAGGLVSDEQTDVGNSGGPGYPTPSDDARQQTYSTLTVRVPPAAYDATVADIAALGTLVSQSRSSADVTDEYVDVQARVTSQEASLNRLLALVDSAARLDDVLSLENEIASRQSDLDSLKARMASLDQEVGMATVVVTLTDDADVLAATAPPTGFVGGLDRGWHAFTSAAGVAFTAIGASLPFVVLFGLIALIARPFVRRYRRRTPAASAAPADV